MFYCDRIVGVCYSSIKTELICNSQVPTITIKPPNVDKYITVKVTWSGDRGELQSMVEWRQSVTTLNNRMRGERQQCRRKQVSLTIGHHSTAMMTTTFHERRCASLIYRPHRRLSTKKIKGHLPGPSFIAENRAVV